MVDRLLITAGQWAQLCGQGEGDQEVMSGKQQTPFALRAIHWPGRCRTWDSGGSCRSDSCSAAPDIAAQ